MRRVSSILSICVAGVFALLSCSRETAMPEDDRTPVEKPSVEPGGGRVLTDFTASLPGATRTALQMDGPDGEGHIYWMKDDPILVSNGLETMTLFIAEGGSMHGDLYAEDKDHLIDGTEFFAIYPAGDASFEGGAFNASIPQEQHFVEGGFDTQVFPMVAVCDDSRHFAFRNAASLLRIVPETSDPMLQDIAISSVVVSAQQPLVGSISVAYNGSAEPEVSCSGNNSVKVVADGEGIPFGTPVYMVIAPGSYSNVVISIQLQNGLALMQKVEERVDVSRSAWKQLEVPLSDTFQNLSETETANCYMITEPGSYKFNASVRGNGVLTSGCFPAGVSAEIPGGSYLTVYHTDGESFIDGSLSLIDGYVYFATKPVLPTGTCLLSLQSAEGETLWSWLLWANSGIRTVEMPNGSEWLNMNLGALHESFSADGYNGYYYQWGRKDPFIQKYTSSAAASEIAPFVSHASQTDGSLINSIRNPQTFYGGWHPSNVSIITEDWCTYDDDEKVYDWWNATYTADDQKELPAAKTMFDPCPPGYHVPVYTEAAALMELNVGKWTDNGRWVENKLFFPASSYRYINIYASYWVTGEPRAFFQCATPLRTGARNDRRAHRPYFTSGGKGVGNGPRSYAIPVRCIKDGWVPVEIIDVASVALDQTEFTLTVGESAQLTATVLPENASDPTVSWSSSDPAVATVEGGLVTALGKGTAVITATAGGQSATCTVTVLPEGNSMGGGDPEDFDPEDWN